MGQSRPYISFAFTVLLYLTLW